MELYVPKCLKYFTKPKMVMFRFLDVIKSKHNLVVELLNYARTHLQDFLVCYWDKPELVDLIEELRDKSTEDKSKQDQSPEIFCLPQTVKAIQDSVLLYVSWKTQTEHVKLDLGIDCPPLQKLLHWVILDGMIDGNFRITIDKCAPSST